MREGLTRDQNRVEVCKNTKEFSSRFNPDTAETELRTKLDEREVGLGGAKRHVTLVSCVLIALG